MDLDEVVATCASRLRRVPVGLQRVVPARLQGDPVDLGRAVDHVLDNAARHATTAVEVTTEADDDALVLHIDGAPLGGARVTLTFARTADHSSRGRTLSGFIDPYNVDRG